MNKNHDYVGIDFRAHPELYKVGRGEMGVLSAEPYKSELLPLWRFAMPETARQSAEAITAKFAYYKAEQDFVGMDMARKFLQMGYTRSRRYANHRGGKKYAGPVPADKKGQSGSHGRAQLPRSPEDPAKAESARIFYEHYQHVKNDPDYLAMKHTHRHMERRNN